MLINKSLVVAGLLALTGPLANAAESEIYGEDFTGEITEWTFSTVNLSSNENWESRTYNDNTFAQANGYSADADSNDWLVSETVTLTDLEFEYAYFQFESAKNYDGGALQVLVSTDYVDNVETATWTDLTESANFSSGGYSWTESGKLDLSEYIGESVTVAFQYTSTPSSAALWQIDNFQVFTTDENPSTEFYYQEEFEGDTLGRWTEVSLASNRDWRTSSYGGNGYASMSGYGGDEPSNDWLISPTTDMTTGSFPYFQFSSAKNYSGNDLKVYYSTDYSDDVETATWIDITDMVELSDGNYNWVDSGRVDLWKLIVTESGERDYDALATVTIAFQYTSTAEASAQWQLDNIEIGSEPVGVINRTEISTAMVSNFDEDFGEWQSVNFSGTKEWNSGSYSGATYVQMSGFRDDADSNDWLVSPAIDMSNFQQQTISFYNSKNYSGPALKLMVTTDVEQGVETPYVDVSKATWTDISDRVTWSQGNFDFVYSGTVDVSDIVDGNAVFAFHYTADDSGSATWQIDHVNVGNVVEGRPVESNFTTYTLEEFNDSFGEWETFSLASDKDWMTDAYIEKTYAEISGFRGDTLSNDWLVSPTIDTTLVDWDEAFVQFASLKGYSGDDLQLLISTDYAGDVEAASWTNITDRADWSEGDFTWTDSGEVDITDFIGGNITVAFQYTSSDEEGAATWRIEYARIVEKDNGFSDVPFEVEDTSGGTMGIFALLLMVVAGARRRFA